MRLKSLELFRFRNLEPQLVSFPSRISLFVGRNGQGKTSLLEAIYILSHAKSFRGGKAKDYVSWSSPDGSPDSAEEVHSSSEVESYVRGEVETSVGNKKVAYEVREGKRKVYLNGNSVNSVSKFYGQCIALEFNPDELQLVKGAPGERRRFLDRTLAMLDPAFVESAVCYQRVIKQRNKAINHISHKVHKEQLSTNDAWQELLPWTEQLIQHGVLVASRRQQFCADLEKSFADYYRLLAAEEKGEGIDQSERTENVSLSYQSDFVDEEGQLLSSETLLSQYQDSLSRDLRTKTTRRGSHRDDVEILFDTTSGWRNSRGIVSQGQARSIALALKLATNDYLEERCRETPILLLDDVESELDQHRKKALYELIQQGDNQVIITATEPSQELLSRLKDFAIYRISAGKVVAE